MTGSLAETVLVFCENGNATELAERVLTRIFEAERNVEMMRDTHPHRRPRHHWTCMAPRGA
jgi:hypothetical protein